MCPAVLSGHERSRRYRHENENASIYRLTGRDALFALLVLGSLWGLSEVALGQAVRALVPEIRAGVLTGSAWHVWASSSG